MSVFAGFHEYVTFVADKGRLTRYQDDFYIDQ
jgi:hypothetical protein